MSNRVTAKDQWKKKGEEVDVPSGKVALCRRVSPDIFLRKGVLPNALMPLVKEALKTGKAPDLEEADIKIDDVEDVLKMYDHVVKHIVIEPKLTLPPEKDEHGEEVEERDPDKLYTDEVDFEDKVFLFNWAVGGTADVEQFRKESQENVGALRSGEDVEHAPEPAD